MFDAAKISGNANAKIGKKRQKPVIIICQNARISLPAMVT
jgi:hypothetical protein